MTLIEKVRAFFNAGGAPSLPYRDKLDLIGRAIGDEKPTVEALFAHSLLGEDGEVIAGTSESGAVATSFVMTKTAVTNQKTVFDFRDYNLRAGSTVIAKVLVPGVDTFNRAVRVLGLAPGVFLTVWLVGSTAQNTDPQLIEIDINSNPMRIDDDHDVAIGSTAVANEDASVTVVVLGSGNNVGSAVAIIGGVNYTTPDHV